MYFVVEKIHIESGDITKIPMAGSPKLKDVITEVKMKLPSYYQDNDEELYGFKTIRAITLIGIENLEYEDLMREIENGQRFYAYKLMYILFGINRGLSSIYFGNNNKKGKKARVQCTMVTGFFGFVVLALGILLTHIGFIHFSIDGWWLIPGLFLSLLSILFAEDVVINIKGGIDMTDRVLSYIKQYIEKNEVQPSVAELVEQENTHKTVCS